MLTIYQEKGTTGITFCHQTGGPTTGRLISRRAYNWDFTVSDKGVTIAMASANGSTFTWLG